MQTYIWYTISKVYTLFNRGCSKCSLLPNILTNQDFVEPHDSLTILVEMQPVCWGRLSASQDAEDFWWLSHQADAASTGCMASISWEENFGKISHAHIFQEGMVAKLSESLINYLGSFSTTVLQWGFRVLNVESCGVTCSLVPSRRGSHCTSQYSGMAWFTNASMSLSLVQEYVPDFNIATIVTHIHVWKGYNF